MKEIAPSYYTSFSCIAGACRHTCCVGWEIEIDEKSLTRFRYHPEIMAHVEEHEGARFRLGKGERCPFLNRDGLCDLILKYGKGILCQICRDHPRFRNFWSDRTELGLGLVCEEAARLILFSSGAEEPMRLVELSDDGEPEECPEDETWLTALRDHLLANVEETGPLARLHEYLIYRHLPDALYEGRVGARIAFIEASVREIADLWAKTDGTQAAMIECVRRWSYDAEYDEEELERRISAFDTEDAETLPADL